MFSALGLSVVLMVAVAMLVGVSPIGEQSFSGSPVLTAANCTGWSSVAMVGFSSMLVIGILLIAGLLAMVGLAASKM